MAAVAPARFFEVPRFSYSACDAGGLDWPLLEALEHHGFALVTDVPTDPATILAFARRLGSLDLGVDEALSGPPVMDLRYDEAKAARFDRPAYFSNNDFPLHTDLSYVPVPPRFLLTLCVAPDTEGGGVSLISDCRAAWDSLYPADRVKLGAHVFNFRNAPNTGDGRCAARALRETIAGYEFWRFRADGLEYPPELADAVGRFQRALDGLRIEVAMKSGDMMVIDNHRMVHGRTAFNVPSARHLLRAYAQDASIAPR